ncbi:hypothetical protein, conserved [Babesia ovata]|uniref:Uncharacterized protein n=1 Tax=Babesia ovata TaxID=189622 RepID=A0A2H6KHT8_9APIC|nr:uncharacterized protein BOVATA_040320 [Babesia ovata]GBE62539.1 hypothetical protein, conserved [Babesia ovata]
MFWLATLIYIRCAVTGIVLDLTSDILPEGVETFYGTFPNGGVYRFIRGIEALITEINYGGEHIDYTALYASSVVYAHVEDFCRGRNRYIRLHLGRSSEKGVSFRYRTVQHCMNKAFLKNTRDLIKFIAGPISLTLDITLEKLHPLVGTRKEAHPYDARYFEIYDRFKLDCGCTVKMEIVNYQIGEIVISQIEGIALGYTAVFRMPCRKITTVNKSPHHCINVDDQIEMILDISHIRKINGLKGNISWNPTCSASRNGAPSGRLESEVVSKMSSLPSFTIEGNNATAASASQVYTRSIYLFVPSQLEYAPLIEQFAMYDPSRKIVTYDMDFLVRHYEPQSAGNSRTTIHMTAAHAVVRSDSSSILLCAASQDPPSYSQAQVPPTEFTLTDAYGANEPFDLENFIIQLMPPGLETIADLLDASDIHIDDDEDDVSSGEFRSLISDLTPTFDQLALPVDHTFAEMEGNAFRG